jgi:CelD/BcsL family acetyltransferase involved in cellulose biosynthesis/glycosyltransferase involved in cell wall biosynthesis
MKLTVLSVAYPFAPVGFDTAGGAEQMVALLDSGLTRSGHRSVVIACEGSRAASTFIPGVERGEKLTRELRGEAYRQYREAIERAIDEYRPNLIHMHGVDFHSYMPAGSTPVLVTLHLPPSWYPAEIFDLRRPNVHLVCVSESQRRACPATSEPLCVIENGIEVNGFLMRRYKRNFVLALGRICPEKGFHIGLDAASRAKIPMLLAGQVFPYEEHENYFRSEILPRLGQFGRFLGPVGSARRRRLLASGQCVVIPSSVPETSSLVAMESIASGTPVVAFPSGALAEIVEDGKTGFLVRDERELAEALKRVYLLDPDLCRRRATERFCAERSVMSYLRLYKQYAAGKTEHACSRSVERTNLPQKSAMSFCNAVTSVEIQEITTVQDLQRIRAEWRELWEQCPDATPFQLPEWLLPWCEHFAGSELLVLALRYRSKLVGMFPIFLHADGPRRVREMSLAGTGISDYLNPLLLPDMSRTASELIFRYLAAHSSNWQCVDLQGLSAGSALLSTFGNAGLKSKIFRDEVCPLLALPPTMTEFINQMQPKLRKNLRRARRYFEGSDGIKVTTACAETLDRHLDELFTLHGSRWRERNLPGVLCDSKVQLFHRNAAAGLLKAGILRVQVLNLGDEAAAAIYWMASKDRAYSYLGGFSPEFERCSPGAVLLEHAVEESIHEGLREFDFLRGSEAYKYAWGARDQFTYKLLLRKHDELALG